jgi:hypothetical protein
MTVEKGNGVTEVITREWPRGRFILVYASINSSSQNVRIFSTYSDNYGADWSPPKQVANTTGIDTGVAVAAIGDNVAYLYRQFKDDSGDNADAVYVAMSTTRGQTIRKPSLVVDNLCAFDQPTLSGSPDPDASPFQTIASRTNNFVDVTSDGSNFVAVLANRLPGPDGCLSRPFEYQAGSRVLVTTAGARGNNWSTPVEIAPRSGQGLPRDGHSFQFMPAVDCVLGQCQAIWYDSIRDSIRNISYLQSSERADSIDAFVNFPFFADFYLPRPAGNPTEVIQFRRTADVFTRRFTVGAGGAPAFVDAEPVRVTQFPLIATSPNTVTESEQLPFSLKQYKGNTASFMGDYIGLASQKFRVVPSSDPTAPPQYEPNNGPASGPFADLLKPSWFAYWTDTRNARGQLYTQNPEEAVPFEKTAIGGANVKLEKESEPNETDPPALVEEGTKLSAEGLEDSNSVEFCEPPAIAPTAPGQVLFAFDNQNRIKDADIFGALIEEPATAWVLNVSKGLGQLIPDPDNSDILFPLQRAYAIAARNEKDNAPKKFRFRIMNQPVGFDDNEARASWSQLPFKDFDNSEQLQAPVEEIDATAGPQSSVTVTLFIVSELAINPVTVNVFEVEDGDEKFVETLTVNGALQAGDLITPFGFLPDVNEVETHDPFVFAPTASVDFSNPEIWNPEIWNPEIWNPEIWNPEIWNVGLEDADDLDNPEIPSPDLSNLTDESGDPWTPGELVAKVDVQFAAMNNGNTTTGYTADFAVNSPLVRQLILDNKVTAQIIVWEDAREDSYQACDFDITAGENRILAVTDITSDDEAGLLTLKIPDIVNNRFGSITYYLESRDKIYFTIRFIAFEGVIRAIAPELSDGGISYVVTSQAANTYEVSLNPGLEQAIENNVPPLLTVNAADFPVELRAEKNAQGEVGSFLPADLITVTPADEFEPTPTVSCDAGSLASPVSPGEFAALGLGTSELSCSATGENQVTGTVTFSVDIVDQDPPVFDAVPDDLLIERESIAGAVADYVLPTATDEIDADVSVACTIPNSTGGPDPDPFPPGSVAPFDLPGPSTSTIVTCVASDDGGKTATTTFTVTVQDTTPPLLTATADIPPVDATSSAGAMVAFGTPTATDAGNVTVGCDATSGSVFPIGTTTVTCTATDDVGLSAQDQFLIIVADTTPPVITDAPDVSFEADTTGGAVVTFTAPSATDFGDAIAVECKAFEPQVTVVSGDFFPIGVTTVTCTATDASGNSSSDTFDVTVTDTKPPALTVPDDITVIFGATVTYEASATDIADSDVDVSCSPPSGTVFPIGTTKVTCTATDDAGLTDSGSFSVNVVLGGTTSLSTNKKSVNSGAVAGFTWVWEDFLGNPVDVGVGNQDVEARPGECPSEADDVLNEDPGTSDIRQLADGSWTFNWQTVDDEGNGIDPGTYCFSVILLTTDPQQKQSAELRVR